MDEYNTIDVDTWVPPPKNDYKKVDPEPPESPTTRHKDARLHWENITLTVEGGDQKATILDGVWGESPQGEVSAIMGPSGSG